MSEVVIETKDLTRIYKRDQFEVTALKDASIKIQKGEFGWAFDDEKVSPEKTKH